MFAGKQLYIFAGAMLLVAAALIIRMALKPAGGTRRSELHSFSIDIGGGMEGGYYNAELTAADEHYATLNIRYCPHNGAQETKVHKTVSIDLLEKAYDIYVTYNMAHWHDYPKTDLEVLDAPSKSYSFWFGEAEMVCIRPRDLELPDDVRPAMRELEAIFEPYLENKMNEVG